MFRLSTCYGRIINTEFAVCLTTILISGKIKSPDQLKEVCESEFKHSIWIENKCYYFHNKELQSYDDVQRTCSLIFKQYGFNNGRLYEPRDAETFAKVYRLAEEFSNYTTLQIWLGMNDNENEGQFRYSSDGGLLTMNSLWAGNCQGGQG